MIFKVVDKIFEKVKLVFAKILCKKTVTSQLHNGESQIVSDGRYFSVVLEIVKSKEKFFNFKRNKIYQVVLEHVTKNEGKQYISFIKKYKFGTLLLNNIDSFKINDSIGNPKKFYFKETGLISPTTLRYIACMVDIHNIFKRNLFLNTVELGAGYGGLFLCQDIKFNYKRYYIFDHKIVNKLIHKYLAKFKLKNKYKILSIEDNFLIPNIDLFISNWAFSELPKLLQLKYINKYIKYSKHGYLTMNSGKKSLVFKNDHLTLDELRKILPKFKTKKYLIFDPSIHHEGNYIIYW